MRLIYTTKQKNRALIRNLKMNRANYQVEIDRTKNKNHITYMRGKISGIEKAIDLCYKMLQI